MKIVIIGLGTIGSTILHTLSGEGNTITIIDEDKDKIEKLIEKYDVQGVVGNGASLDIQREAGVADADMTIVLTGSDELNVFACLVAKKLGVRNTVARVRNPEYRRQILEMKDELGIAMIVNPEQDTASEIYQLINDLATRGKCVIMVSSEMPELLGICDRILVMSGGRLAGQVDARAATQEDIMALAAKYV